MKLQFIKSFAVLALMSGFAIGCANDDHYPAEESECVDPGLTANKTVASLVAAANSTATLYTSATDDIMEAYVTSTDERGQFFKSVSFQTMPTDGSEPIGFSVAIDDTNLYTKDLYPGRKVFIKMNGLYYAIVDGSLKIGGLFGSQVGRISQFTYKNNIIPSCDEVSEDDLVTEMSIGEANSNSALNRLIEISDVQFAEAEIGEPYYTESLDLGGATNRTITDLFGSQMIFRVSSFANFSGDLIPSTSGKVRGVMTKFSSDFQFLPRRSSDIMLTEPRLEPLTPVYEETFTSNWTQWVKFSVSGSQQWSLDTANHGNPGNCARMSGFSGGAQVNEDWLISPAYDLSALSSAILTYDTATDFTGNALQVFVSTNYSGSGSPAAATWTPVTGTLAPTDSNYVWTGSGPVNISAYAGNTIYVAFKYTSTSSAAATWEVDNVKIIGN